MSLVSEINDAFVGVGTDVGQLQTLLNGGAANLAALTTTDKTNLVAALNEVDGLIASAAVINDAVTGSSTAWSSTKISAAISAAIAGLVDGAPAALDTLNELAAALNDDAGVVSGILAAQAKRVAVDAAQSFTAPEQLQGCNNLGIGNPTTDFLTAYATARDA